MSPELMNDIFYFAERPSNSRSDYILDGKQDHTVYHGSDSLSFLAPKLWDLLPNSIKNSASLKKFKILGNLTTVLVEYARNMLGE